jgi:hypothetical protein
MVVDQHGLAGRDVEHHLETEYVKRNAFLRDHVFFAIRR